MAIQSVFRPQSCTFQNGEVVQSLKVLNSIRNQKSTGEKKPPISFIQTQPAYNGPFKWERGRHLTNQNLSLRERGRVCAQVDPSAPPYYSVQDSFRLIKPWEELSYL